MRSCQRQMLFATFQHAKLTDLQCRKLLTENTNQVKGDNNNLVRLINAVSLYRLDVNQVREILNEAAVNITMIAEENAELSIDC